MDEQVSQNYGQTTQEQSSPNSFFFLETEKNVNHWFVYIDLKWISWRRHLKAPSQVMYRDIERFLFPSAPHSKVQNIVLSLVALTTATCVRQKIEGDTLVCSVSTIIMEQITVAIRVHILACSYTTKWRMNADQRGPALNSVLPGVCHHVSIH